MITDKQKTKFRKLLTSFLKDENIKPDDIDFNKLLRGICENLATKNYYDNQDKLTQEDKNDFFELHKKFVIDLINFINHHLNIKNLITETQKLVSAEWNNNITEENLKLYPNIRFYFSADNLINSLNNQRWLATTDSYLSINSGNQIIIESC